MNTKDLANKKVWTSRPTKNDPDAVKKVGRIHAFVFHPTRPQLVGFLVKRPDVALMFRREDMFVAFNGFDIVPDGTGKEGSSHEVILVREQPEAVGRGATKALGVNLDACVIWLGLPVMTADGSSLGVASEAEFDPETGRVTSLVVSQGATANTLLGRRAIPGELLRGFKRGMGTQLYLTDDDSDPDSLGALVVADEAWDVPVEGGAAEKAGEATAIATDKAKRTYKRVVQKVKPAAADAAKVASEKAGEAAKVAGAAVEKGAFATGRQLERAKGMFGNFKDEFKKAMSDDDE